MPLAQQVVSRPFELLEREILSCTHAGIAHPVEDRMAAAPEKKRAAAGRDAEPVQRAVFLRPAPAAGSGVVVDLDDLSGRTGARARKSADTDPACAQLRAMRNQHLAFEDRPSLEQIGIAIAQRVAPRSSRIERHATRGQPQCIAQELRGQQFELCAIQLLPALQLLHEGPDMAAPQRLQRVIHSFVKTLLQLVRHGHGAVGARLRRCFGGTYGHNLHILLLLLCC
jgi:hypothetical protein